MEISKLIIESDGETPTSAMCSLCRAIFPVLTPNDPDSNKRLLESVFQEHVKAEHSDQPPPCETAHGDVQ